MDHNNIGYITKIWILVNVFLYCRGASLEKTPTTGNLTLKLGQKDELKCELSCFFPCGQYKMEWKKQENYICEGITFPIESAKYEDAGTYKCYTDHKRGHEGIFNVEVQGAPNGTPKITPQKLLVRVRETFSLTCNTSSMHKGIPEGKYKWCKDGKCEDNHHDIYHHTPEIVSTGGVYSCQLWNTIGYSRIANSTVTVEAPPVIEAPPTNQSYQPIYDDQDFNISFIISGSHLTNFSLSASNSTFQINHFNMSNEPLYGNFKYGQQKAQLVSFQWILNDVNLNSCKDVTYFNGIYKFEVEGFAAGNVSSQESIFSIDVQYPAIWNREVQNQTTPQCIPKTLYCDVCAEPAPTNYRWSFMGEELVNATGGELYLRNTSRSDFGWYTCTVTNFINGDGYKTVFNITLDEDGSPHSPSNFGVKSRTSKTLLLSWENLLKECYELEFEIGIWNGTTLQEFIFKDCKQQKHCEVRVMNLTASSKYLLNIRARTRKDENNWFYSERIKKEGITTAIPEFTNVEIKISETSIEVRWKYGTETKTLPMEVETEDVSVVIYYKKSGDPKFMEHPENETIPAEAGVANIKGEFDTSASYLIGYKVYEGDQLAIEEKPAEITPSEPPANPLIIVGAVGGVVIGVVLLCLLIFGLWYHQKKRSSPQTHGAKSAPQNDISLADCSSSRHEMNTYENVAMEADETAPSYHEVGPAQVQTPEQTPMYANVDKGDPKKENIHGPGLAYVELEFVEQKDESKVQQIHGAENTVDYSELDHDKMKPDNNDCYF